MMRNGNISSNGTLTSGLWQNGNENEVFISGGKFFLCPKDN